VRVCLFGEGDVFGVGGEWVGDWGAVAEGSFEDSVWVRGAQGFEEFGADGGEGLEGVDVQDYGCAVEFEA
jgi:hypothetical protein